MKRCFFILFMIISSLTSHSQVTPSNEINAEGNAILKVKPDLASLKITVEKQNLIQKEAIKAMNEEIETLKKILSKIGFTEKNIKISDFEISSQQDDNNKKEYTVSCSLTITFILDNKILEEFYQEIQANSIKDTEIEFDAYLSDELEKASRKKLVQLAIQDAKSNAETIAQALDVKLNNIKLVSKYSNRNLGAYDIKADMVKFNKPVTAMMMQPKTVFDKYEVEEIEIEESITIVYEIVKK